MKKFLLNIGAIVLSFILGSNISILSMEIFKFSVGEFINSYFPCIESTEIVKIPCYAAYDIGFLVLIAILIGISIYGFLYRYITKFI